MLMYQPFFIGGIEDVEVAKGSAFGAAGTFLFTFVVSIVFMINDARKPPIIRNSNDQPTDRLSELRLRILRRGGGSGDRLGEYGQVNIYSDHSSSDRDLEPITTSGIGKREENILRTTTNQTNQDYKQGHSNVHCSQTQPPLLFYPSIAELTPPRTPPRTPPDSNQGPPIDLLS